MIDAELERLNVDRRVAGQWSRNARDHTHA
jgi:hypothetical protein